MRKILIVGGGPIGMGLAVGLVREGIPVNVIEKESDISTFPKASTIHPPTLEILDKWGLFDKAKKIGKTIDRIQYWNRKSGELIAEFNLDLLKPYTKFPYRLHFDQQFLTRIFLDYLLEQDLANVRFETEMKDISQDNQKVKVRIQDAEGQHEEYYDYVIGADGISSTVREKMGITFTGHTNPRYHLLMGLKNYKISSQYPDLAGVAMFLDDKEWVDMITSADMLKVIVPMSHSNMDEIDDQFVRSKVKEVGIVKEGFDIFYKTIYKTHQLVADRLVDGRVLLVGDAAHVNIEFGGMGMNSGLHDTYLLIQKLKSIFNGGKQEENLEEFARLRLKVNREVVQRDTIRNNELIQNVSKHETQLRDMSRDKELAVKYLLRTSMIEGFRMMFEEKEGTKS